MFSHADPDRKLNLLAKRLGRLRAAVKHGEGQNHIVNAAEKLRLAELALIKAKRSLNREYPRRDPDGKQSGNLQDEEQRWLTISIGAIVEEYGKSDS